MKFKCTLKQNDELPILSKISLPYYNIYFLKKLYLINLMNFQIYSYHFFKYLIIIKVQKSKLFTHKLISILLSYPLSRYSNIKTKNL